jgi:phage baseplate assembly protein W|tara:strand:+ start:974 stop:1372 length:399 start_codon:yes stop_codon:yes gene_type:complete
MPREVKFKDLSISMGLNPITEDVLVTTGEAAVKRALYNIIMTRKGERFFKPDLGSNIAELLFEPLDAATASLIQEEITYVIRKYEPRVNLLRADVDANYDNNGFDVAISFEIVGVETDVQVREVEFFLERTR